MRVEFCAAVQAELGSLPGVAVGVGPVLAALGAGAWLSQQRPEAVVLLGTCGSYPGGPPIGTVVASRSLGLGSAAVALGEGYAPLAPAAISGSEVLLARLNVLPVRVLTVQAVSTGSALIARFAADWDVEHMEAFAVARACADHDIPFVALLGVSNRVGPNAHVEWRGNRAHVEAAVRSVAARLWLG